MQVIWSPAALREVARIFAYLENFNPRAAADMARAILAAGDSLENFPYRGRPVAGTKLRELALPYPYVIRYRIAAPDHVRILRVCHGRRRPTTP